MNRRPAPRREAFTLIELLVVISIIAILAGLAFPAVQGALESGKDAQARNDVNQIAMAFKAYQLEYGKLPGGSGNTDGAPDNTWIATLTGTTNNDNRRGITFIEAKAAKPKGQLWVGGTNGSDWYDPWGNKYQVTCDYSYDNRVSNLMTTVIVATTNKRGKVISNAQ